MAVCVFSTNVVKCVAAKKGITHCCRGPFLPLRESPASNWRIIQRGPVTGLKDAITTVAQLVPLVLRTASLLAVHAEWFFVTPQLPDHLPFLGRELLGFRAACKCGGGSAEPLAMGNVCMY